MPRITRIAAGCAAFQLNASMRPGRNAPDNGDAQAAEVVDVPASMRPGRNAPDNAPEVADA